MQGRGMLLVAATLLTSKRSQQCERYMPPSTSCHKNLDVAGDKHMQMVQGQNSTANKCLTANPLMASKDGNH